MTNYQLVEKGLRILLPSLSGYIGQTLNRIYKDKWWNEVLRTLSDQYDLRPDGTYGERVDSLDIANCIRVLDRMWNEVFSYELPKDCRTWAKEIMGVRNKVYHHGSADLDQPEAERALNTMLLLCRETDSDAALEIEELYREVRKKADDMAPATVIYTGAEQPESQSKRGALKDGSLLQLIGTDDVQATTMSRKVTFGGKTEVFPVYRVRLDRLFYNDQNDRIATWLTKYEAENGEDALSKLSREEYNNVIENFIYESNPEAIMKTKKNIGIVGQREPGVTLADGRIVDGNRRFTCLRKIQRDSSEPVFFETVIMDMDIQEDRKQIKLLELALQHGEEKKVDYDMIDYAIGTFRDVEQTRLITIDEYARSTNESVSDVKKRIEIAGIIQEFLEFIGLPGQYHVAREYQVYSLFEEMMPPLRALDEDGKRQLKTIAFGNTILKAFPDQRKFIRDIRTLVRDKSHTAYFAGHEQINAELKGKIDTINNRTKENVDSLAAENKAMADKMKTLLENALQSYRARQLKSKPTDTVSKCITEMLDIDPRLFAKLDPNEKQTLAAELDELINVAQNFRNYI